MDAGELAALAAVTGWGGLVTVGGFALSARLRRPRRDGPVQPPKTDPGGLHRVEGALAAGVQIVLQPIVDLHSGQLRGVEALSRFPDGRSPELWFAEAARVGRGADLEVAAVTAAIELMPHVPAEAYLAINLSPAVIGDARVTDVLSDQQGHRLVVEVTEHHAIQRYDVLSRLLQAHRALGVRIAVDDAGAGYASFAHVLHLRPDIIKIDGSVVRRAARDAAARALIAAVVRLARELDATVVGEGAEHAVELETLRILGVDAAQGFGLARPTPVRSEWLQWQTRNWRATDEQLQLR